MSNEEKIIAMLSELKADMDGMGSEIARLQYEMDTMKSSLATLRGEKAIRTHGGSHERDMETIRKMGELLTKEEADALREAVASARKRVRNVA